MKLKAPKGNPAAKRVEQDVLEPGTYPARVAQVLCLGLQPQRPYQGEEKPPAVELMMTYELVDEFMKDEAGELLEDKPRWLSETFPFRSMEADLAKSTKRYKAIDPENVFDGDFSELVGCPCNVTVVNNAKGEKVYTNVTNVSSMRPKDAARTPELKNDSKVFNPDEPDMKVFLALPDWLQEKIKANLEFNGSALQKALANPAGVKEEPKEKAAPKKAKPAPVEDEEEDGEEEKW
jgi:hypothetical protein